MSSFSIALSGLNADSAALDVVGNNLANLNTTGFKDSTVSFYDLLQQSVAGGSTQIGGGVSAPQTERIFTQGSIQNTGGAYDAAINGNGFFVVQDPSGNTLYTRAGNFQLNAAGDLITATGQFVQGWSAQGGVVNTSGAIGNITIPSDALQTPSATQNFSLNVNLNAAGVVGEPSGTFSAVNTTTGAIAWQYKSDRPMYGGALATAGGLVFTGEMNGDFDAFDAKSGDKLWHYPLGAGVCTPPITYKIRGVQYIAVGASGCHGGEVLMHADGRPIFGDSFAIFALPG